MGYSMNIKKIIKSIKCKPMRHYEVGGYTFDFYFKANDARKSYLEISTESGIVAIRLDARTHTFGYLYVAAEKGMMEQLHGYAVLLTNTAEYLCKSQEFVDAVTKALTQLVADGLAEADAKAAAITEQAEMASQAFMEDVVRAAEMTKEERELDRVETREIVEELMREESYQSKSKNAQKRTKTAKKRNSKKK